MKRILLAALAFVFTAGASSNCTGTVPIVASSDNMVVYVSFQIRNLDGPTGGIASIIFDASGAAQLGPNHFEIDVNTGTRPDSPKPRYGEISDTDGIWSYPVGIHKGSGSVTISLKVAYLAADEDSLLCWIKNGSDIPVNDHAHATKRTLLTVFCSTVVTY